MMMDDKGSREHQVAGEEAATAQATGRREQTALGNEGRRRVNFLWEQTQMRIALIVVVGMKLAHLSVVGVILYLLVTRRDPSPVFVAVLSGTLAALSSTMSLVVGFYFGRTDHQRRAATAQPPDEP